MAKNRKNTGIRSGSEHQIKPSPGLGLFVFLAVWITLPQVQADSIRCGHKLLGRGDTLEALRQNCGEPKRRDFSREEFWFADGLKKIRLERWYYKMDSGKLERIVLTYKGEIVGVRTGDR